MGKALYRKYRSKSLSEIIGQEHITDTLGRALKQNMFSHAYLLTGPKGVGKTSVARILAYEVNGLPYDDEGTHLDIIEIDAASNRRIDEIRELKERVNIAPTSAKYKVYIIDEVHMLTKEAFNALLKTLEEPPDHAIFILATTEAHKVPETIQSRTQRFTFKPVKPDKVVAHLKMIAKNEAIDIEDIALELIASHGEGSFRDSISLLDQVRHTTGRITLPAVQQAIGQAPEELLSELLAALGNKNIQAIAGSLAALRAHGVQAAQIARQISSRLRQHILDPSMELEPSQALKLLAELLQVPAGNDPGLALELALYGSALEGFNPKPNAKSDGSHAHIDLATDKPDDIPDEAPQKNKPRELKVEKAVKTHAIQAKTNASKTATEKLPKQGLDESSWLEVLTAVKVKYNTLYGITRMAVPTFNDGKLILSFAFPFHQKKLNDARNKQLLQDIISEVTGSDVAIDCILDGAAEPLPLIAKREEKPQITSDLEAISNIFGGAEIVE